MTLPKTMLKWNFYGDGLDSLKLEEAPVPVPEPDQILVRQDACGLCFSDTKVIALGKDHPRMVGRDLARNPVTLGHEVSCTVVAVGSEMADRFRVGDRFIIQADVFYKGVSMAYGYVISGGLAEYSIIPREMIEGDEGCYLLPIRPDMGVVETALVEPWACVVAAYNQAHRPGVKPGGRLLVVAGEGAERADWSGVLPDEPPATVVYIGGPAAGAALRDALGGGVVLTTEAPRDWLALKRAATGTAGFDDVLLLGELAPEVLEGASSTLADHGIACFVRSTLVPRKLTLDIGRIHYNWHHYVGTAGTAIAEAYQETRGADVLPGGLAWFIGAGGPMGQMHVQRAVQHPRPPRLVLGTDIDTERLKSVEDRLGSVAEARGVTLVLINPKEMSPEEFDRRLQELTDGRGFDDIVSLVPVPALIEHAAGFLADGAWMNIFAGVARGTMASLDANDIIGRRVRYIGSSGSSIADMLETLRKVERGELSTNASLAAVGGMRAAREGIAAVKEGRFPGKSLVFPIIHDMPLLSLQQLREQYPSVHALLKDGKFWTNEAERELMRLHGLDA